MPEQKKKAARRRPAPVYVIEVLVYDPDNHRGNERLIIEGPFTDRALAVQTLESLLKSRLYTTASTRVIPVNNAAKFQRLLDDIRRFLQ